MEEFIEKLEEAHEFPGPYMMKVIGKNEPAFVALVLGVTRRVLDLDVDPEYSNRTTRSGRHVSVTLELTVESAVIVATLYEQMQTVDGLTMVI
jgi:putative lipoic acid-binding regulatory protein